MASTERSGANWSAACGNSGSKKRKKPYVPIFSRTAASTTLPAVGASTWASGSHVCRGQTGTLMAKASANAPKSQACRGIATGSRPNRMRSKVRSPGCAPLWRYSVMIATSISALPAIVYRMNLIAA